MSSWKTYINEHVGTALALDPELIDRFTSDLVQAIANNKSIFAFGNGGSAATANHFSADLALLKIRTGINCRCLSLNTDLSLSTAISNDVDYKSVISRQVEIFAGFGDIVVGFSASGNSLNIIEGFRQAIKMGVRVWGVTGFDGGEIKKMVGVNVIHFPTPRDYGLVENLHLCVAHYVVDRLVQTFKIVG